MKRPQPLHESPQPRDPRARLPSPTDVPEALTTLTCSTSALFPCRNPTQTQTAPPLMVAPLELQPSWLVGSSAHGWVRAVKPSGNTAGDPLLLAIGVAAADGPVVGPRLGDDEGLGAWLTVGVADGDSTATPPPKMPEMNAPTPIARIPSSTKPPIASGLIPEPRRFQ